MCNVNMQQSSCKGVEVQVMQLMMSSSKMVVCNIISGEYNN